MADIFKQLVKDYEAAEPDPRTRHWLMIYDSPIPVWTVTSLYLLTSILGPRFMKDRKPFSLQYLMIVYNIGLVLLSSYMFIELILAVVDAGYNMWCADFNEASVRNPKEMRVAKVMWWYFISKVLEFNDTFLMILRKKFNQITFLHVFHHATMLNIWWWTVMFIPGGTAWFGAWLNCLVHMVMYSYYGLSAIPALKGKLWWKRYITTFQLVQFCLTFAHTANSLRVGCDFPPWGQYLLTSYMVVMLGLFGNFYVKSYINVRKTKADKVAAINGKNGVYNKQENGKTNGHIRDKRE